MYQYPTLHRPVPMGSRVTLPNEAIGEVVGIASIHIIFQYIVLLDIPHQDVDYGLVKAVTVSGCELRDSRGDRYWAFKDSVEHSAYLTGMQTIHDKPVGSLGV